MPENVIISKPENLEKLKKKISKSGTKKFHVISDFDKTLTKKFVDGKRILSVISILRDGNYLSPDYRKKAQELFDKYHPIEMDPNISFKEKKKAMLEWWTTHFDLLIKSGLNKNDLKKVVESSKVQFREGALEFIDFLHEREIPLLIISSSGLGDAVLMYFKEKKKLYDNIHIITNLYKWDKKGNAIGVRKPIIHSLNKDETSIKDYPVFNVIKERKNVLLLGDMIEDAKMIKGFDYNNIIKIGFLNDKIKERLKSYKETFDIVLLNDTSMNYVNQLLKELF